MTRKVHKVGFGLSITAAALMAYGLCAAPTVNAEDDLNVRFAECLREHGLDVPIPEPGKGVKVIINEANRGVGEGALQACRDLNPLEHDPEAAQRAEAAVRSFAECMRSNGVESFPEPAPGQRGIRITGDIRNDADFAAAREACRID
jgi:hypothetical protein